jgi:hypothetical protein
MHERSELSCSVLRFVVEQLVQIKRCHDKIVCEHRGRVRSAPGLNSEVRGSNP